MTVSFRSGTRVNPAKRSNAIKNKMIDQMVKRTVMTTNQDIMELFKSLGMDYVPFLLSYHQSRSKGKFLDYDPTKTPYKSGNVGANLATTSQGASGGDSSGQQGSGDMAVEGDIWKYQKNISLDIDQDFLAFYFKDKVDYNLWLSRKYPELQRESWWALRNNNDPPAEYQNKQKEYYNEMGDKAIKPFEGSNIKTGKDKTGRQMPWSKTTTGKSNIVGYIQSRPTGEFNSAIRGGDRYGAKNWKSFTTKDVQKFTENEGFLFRGNLQRFLSTADDRVVKVLMDVLTQFQEELLNLDLNDFEPRDYEDKPDNDKEIREGIGKRQKKFLQETADFKNIWKPEPKFPNIRNIRTWFLRTGIYNSNSFDEFLTKTPKGKANWIDRSVFLIANGVYAKALGQKTSRMSADMLIDLYLSKKVFVQVKQPIYPKQDVIRDSAKDRAVANTQRQKDYEVWKAENSTAARGWKNRYDGGRSKKPKKDSPRYDWRLGK